MKSYNIPLIIVLFVITTSFSNHEKVFEVDVSHIADDLYKIENTNYYFETIACYEYVYYESAKLLVSSDGSTGSIIFNNTYDDLDYMIVEFFEYEYLDSQIYFENEYGEFSKSLAYLKPISLNL